jgi:CHASE3 domain sensor protein
MGEVSEAYFKLAGMFVILAGFMFTASGLSYQSSINLKIITGNNEISKIQNANNASNEYNFTVDSVNVDLGETQEDTSRRYVLFFVLGVILAVLSIYFWYWGFNKIKK